MIDKSKKYRYAGASGIATILMTDRPGNHLPVLSVDMYGGLFQHDSEGKSPASRWLDLIEIVPAGEV